MIRFEAPVNLLPGLSAKLRAALETVVEQTAAQIEGGAKEGAPVDTGNLRASITHSASGLEGEVSVGADYAVHVHYGTEHQSPQPFLLDAVNEAEADFQNRINRAVKGAVK
jgi:HK97 gp10 family phage protein